MRILGLILILLSLPVFVGVLRGYPRARKWAYLAIGALPFFIAALNLDAAFINWSAWSGYAKGLVVSLLDTLALAVLATSRGPLRQIPFLGVLFLYLIASLVSMLVSTLPMGSAFYAFQLVRVIIVFAAVSTFAGDPRAVRWLCFGLALGAIFQALVAIDQRFSGVVQASGTMGHQNLLGLMLHFVTLPLLALLLAGERNRLIMAGLLAALVAVALGASRGAIAFVALGILLLYPLSLIRRPTPHKWKIGALGIVALAIVVPLAISSFQGRFADRPIYEGSDGERLAFERAARAMWDDHPLGVGANQYVVVANSQGYSERAGVTWSYASRATNVHNLYLLTAAEMGWPGLVSLILLLTWPVLRGLGFAFARQRDPRGDIVLGASVAILIVALHGFIEWIFVTGHAQYLFATALGLIAGSIRRARLERRFSARLAARTPPPPAQSDQRRVRTSLR